MKKYTKLMALLLVLAVSVMAFAGCGGKNNSSNAEVEAVLNSFLDALISFDPDVMSSCLDYVKPDTDYYNELSESIDYFRDSWANIDDEITSAFNSEELFGEYSELFEDDFNKFSSDVTSLMDGIFTSLANNSSYEIGNIKINGNSATVEVTVTMPDIENDWDPNFDFVDELFADSDLSEYGYDENELIDYVMSAVGVESMDDLYNVSEEDLEYYSYKYMADNRIFANMLDTMMEGIEDELQLPEATVEVYECELELVDGKWLITENE